MARSTHIKTDDERKRQGSRGYGTKYKGLLKLPPLAIVPPPPPWLRNVDAKQLWTDTMPVMIEHRVMNHVNLHAYAIICATYGQLLMQYEATENMDPRVLAVYHRLISDFGMTPAAMVKAQIVTDDPNQPIEDGNPFLKNKNSKTTPLKRVA